MSQDQPRILEIIVCVSIIALRSFYASLLGQHVQQTIAGVLKCYYRAIRGERIMGFGYAIPYLAPFSQKAERCFAFMPAHQGASIWPSADRVATALIFEGDLPLSDASVDCIIMVHALEYTENAEETMRELWRVLVPNGRLIVVVTNRSSLWAHAEFTPFGKGESYSHYQLQKLLGRTNFFYGPITETLHFLPRRNWHFGPFPSLGEKILQWFCPYFGGVLIIEAQKRLYKSMPVPKRYSHGVFVPAFHLQAECTACQDISPPITCQNIMSIDP
ncbi:MAG: Methyltransferase [Candidatus Tokpelaia sp. JSC189]|nr:MAG: Methyltransferase [Candidatus Tokpelaia sp. JSC189]